MSASAASPGEYGQPLYSTLLILWTVVLCARDLVIPTSTLAAALKTLSNPLWLLRMRQHDGTWRFDVLACLAADYLLNNGFHLFTPSCLDWFQRKHAEHVIIYPLFAFSALCSAVIVTRGDDPPSLPHPPLEVTEEQLLPPMLIPARTTHTRLFPKRHSFSYSYLLVGVPVGWKGRAGSAISVDTATLPEDEQRIGCFTISAEDYLDRSNHHLGLEGKLKVYLRSQGVEDKEWSFAYLVTAPRFLGYSFNPVSFWYLYDEDADLKFMVLEVNNTFDERRMYLLKGDLGPSSLEEHVDRAHSGLSFKRSSFTNAWEKDFHVSPFNSRQGSYTLTTKDPLESNIARTDFVDNVIVLKSSQEHAKLVARVFSTGAARDPATLSTGDVVVFILSWCWVGFLTSPRIVYQASKLYFKHKLPVFFRPEVTLASIGRTPAAEEVKLEVFFRAYVQELARRCSSPLILEYHPPDGMARPCAFHSPSTPTKDQADAPVITFRMLSPAFYSRFIHYGTLAEALNRECIATDELNRTVDIKNTHLLDLLLSSCGSSDREPTSSSLADTLRWRFLRTLRTPAPAQSYPSEGQQVPNMKVQDIRPSSFSDLDVFVQTHLSSLHKQPFTSLSSSDDDDDHMDANTYRRTVTRLFLAQRFAFGITPLISLFDMLIRICLVVAGLQFAATQKDISLFHWGHANTEALPLLIATSGVHLWAWIKGI